MSPFFEMQAAAPADLQVDPAAGRRELHGVAHEVGQDLLEPSGVAEERDGRGRIDVDQAFQFAGHTAAHGHVADAQQHLVEHERRGVHVHLAGLDLGEVQRVVDDVEQGVGEIEDGPLAVARQGIVLEVGEPV